MSLIGWQDMSCECGSKHFQQIYTMAWHEQYGTTSKLEGLICIDCGKRTDNNRMIRRVKERNLKTKIKELEDQL